MTTQYDEQKFICLIATKDHAMKPENTFTLVHHGDLLLAVVPDGTDWKAEVFAECKRASIAMLDAEQFEEYEAEKEYDPNVFSIQSLRIVTNQVLTDHEPSNRADISHKSNYGGQIIDPDGREWRFARSFTKEADPQV